MKLSVCSCKDRCTTTDQMAERHGTPMQFKKSVWAAVPSFISADEAFESLLKYTEEWAAVSRNGECVERGAKMKLVIIESPYAGDVVRNQRYLKSCIRDCIFRGESPYASHRMLTEALNDNDPRERDIGIGAGLAWREAFYLHNGTPRSVLPVFYTDLGISSGMQRALDLYKMERRPHEERKLLPDDPFFSSPEPNPQIGSTEQHIDQP